MLYVRKIKPEKWTGLAKYDSDSISDLETTNHELSVWRLNSKDDKENIDKVALALAMCCDKPAEIMLVLIDPDNLKDHKGRSFRMDLSEQEGATRFKKMKDEHVNFILPSIFELGHLASNIHELLKDISNVRYYNVQELADLFYEACDRDEISPDDVIKSKWGNMLKARKSG